MRMSGFSALAASAMPPMRPPPDNGTTIAARSGRSSSSSSAMVPWPAMTCGWSKGGISVRPSLGTSRSTLRLRLVLAVADAADLGARAARIARTLVRGTRLDRQMVARTPARARHRRRRARDCRSNSRPTPRLRCRREGGDRIGGAAQLEGADRLQALELQQDLLAGQVQTAPAPAIAGVRGASPAMALRAARMSASVGADSGKVMGQCIHHRHGSPADSRKFRLLRSD